MSDPIPPLLKAWRQRLAPIPWMTQSIRFSPDLAHVAFVFHAEGRFAIHVDGSAAGPKHAGVMEGHPVFSPDSAHLAWAATDGARWSVWRDGEQVVEVDAVGRTGLTFSPDSQHLAFQAVTAGRWTLVVDGAAGELWDDLGVPSFSAQGRVAFPARRGDEQLLVVGDDVVLTGDEVRFLGWPARSERWLAKVRRGDRWSLVRGGETLYEADEIGATAVTADGSAVAAALREGLRWHLGDGDYQAVGSLRLGPSGQIGAVVRTPEGWRVLHGGETSLAHAAIGEGAPVFSPSGRVAWWARDGSRSRVFVDGEVVGEHPQIGAVPLTFSAAGALAWLAGTEDGRWSVVVDGRVLSTHTQVARLRFSPRGDRLAWVGQLQGKWAVAGCRVDGTGRFISPPLEAVGTDVGGGVVFEGEDRLRFTSIEIDGIYTGVAALASE